MERTDLVDDPGQRERVDRMKADLHAWMREVVRSVNGEDY
jgi:hypothetical protein